ncbi:triose-phosphate isomerase family protein [Agrococcus jejuensis]|uniref:Triosephosphate isomerase n=1 Tax=Agrococcus jejuensis TaxID=399736 RepID=A0A1G8FB62_9MICO|nr:triose-phosphate isomerase family protein [Agrococcus jejuensis]SDH79322.1 triosephosphate isomerase [Agrococcus jejuensis]
MTTQLPTTMTGCSPKGYLTADAAREWIAVVRDGLAATGGVGAFACMPYPLVAQTVEALAPLGALVGTQDVSAHPVGPFTGEVSAELLAGLGSTLAMVGHPERVRHVGEGPEDFAAKSEAAAAHGIVPILIVGEPERGRDPEEVIRPQLDVAFARVPSDAPVVVAYEPTWAIGAPEPAPPSHVVDVVERIRGMLAERAGESRVLYGGSAGPGTFAAIAAHGREVGRPAGIPDGVFLGRAGVDPRGFLAAVAEVREATAS